MSATDTVLLGWDMGYGIGYHLPPRLSALLLSSAVPCCELCVTQQQQRASSQQEERGEISREGDETGLRSTDDNLQLDN